MPFAVSGYKSDVGTWPTVGLVLCAEQKAIQLVPVILLGLQIFKLIKDVCQYKKPASREQIMVQ